MGAAKDEEGASSDEYPQHSVTIAPFYMGKFAITQVQWQAIATLPKINHDLNPDPSNFKGANRPVEQISWFEAVEFCDRLTQKTGNSYRLPSEAEWEYACRAGTTTPFHFGETISTDLANYRRLDIRRYYSGSYGKGAKDIYREQTTDVGSFSPNAFGLYDMHGNVWEWCSDRWHDNYQGAPNTSGEAKPTDGSVWEAGDSKYRLLRGGSWNYNPLLCRSANRLRNSPENRNQHSSVFGLSAFPPELFSPLISCPLALYPSSLSRKTQIQKSEFCWESSAITQLFSELRFLGIFRHVRGMLK